MDDWGVENREDLTTAPPSCAESLRAPRLVLSLFTATTFLSAALLFSLQPLFAKMVLPVLGGSPSVWAVAVCFFQAALLAGYGYAHLLIVKLSPTRGGLVHLGICLLATILLPIGPPKAWGEPPPGDPYLWQLGLFTLAVGLPFTAIAANAPLLQAWFARSGHPHAANPYFLYAASNLGSLIALISYPFVLEPMFSLRMLSRMWSLGFLALILALALCFLQVRDRTGKAAAREHAWSDDGAAPTWGDRLAWTGLALVPAALLTAFTTHISTDVASAPLVWVLPLALYLLTFVLMFREPPLIARSLVLTLQPVAIAVAMLALAQTKHDSWFVTALTGVAAFFAAGLVAHRTLYEARPRARFLTEYYLWMAFGGALGGLAAALLAPKVFSEVFEYPLLLALSMACRPGVFARAAMLRFLGSAAALVPAAPARRLAARLAGTRLSENDRNELLVLWLIIAGGALAIYWIPWAVDRYAFDTHEWGSTALAVAPLAGLLVWQMRRTTRQFVAALVMFAALVSLPSAVKRGQAQRSYFGVYRVQASDDGEFRTLVNGSTLHGAQRIRDAVGNSVDDATPATYYYEASPMAMTIAKVRERLGVAKGRFGVVGLGTGSLACHSRPGEAWRFFEIDPLIVAIATDPRYFSFLAHCQPTPDVVIGDARRTMSKEPNASFDLIIVDAFSSDAVPVHLMTAEALRLYLDKLKPDGIALLHISNRYLDLDSVLGATVKLLSGVEGFIIADDDADGSYAQSTSTVAVFAKNRETLAPLRELKETREFDAHGLRAWSDDYSDILGPFIGKLRTP
jgi:SAM-dependent methyltransferase